MATRAATLRDVGILAACAAAVGLGARAVKTAPPAPVPSAPAASGPAALPGAASATQPAVSLELRETGCSFPDEGIGDYRELDVPGPVRAFARDAALRPDGAYDLVLHVHGGIAAQRVLLPRALPLNLATLDLGDSSNDYRYALGDRRAVDTMIGEIDRAVGAAAGRQARADRLVLSSFSAGYPALHDALVALGDEHAPSGVLLLDSLHAGRAGGGKGVDASKLGPFVAAARRALDGRGTFALTHSRIVPPDYASTEEVATWLLGELGVRSNRVEAPAQGGLALVRIAEERGFTVRGYAGGDAEAHCAHLGLLADLVEDWMEKR